MKKRVLSTMLVLCMVLGFLPRTVWATGTLASGTCGDNLTWVLDDEGTLTITGTGDMEDYSGYSGDIPAPWLDKRSNIRNIIIQNGVTSIGNHAFINCALRATSNIVIPDSVTRIGEYAFGECGGMSGTTAGLANIVIPHSVVTIEDYAFAHCNRLEHISIPKSVTSIGKSVFFGCDSMSSAGPLGGGYDFEFSWTEEIPENAFNGFRSLTSITIPDSVCSIGDSAFVGCDSLTSIVVPDSVTSIGISAFSYCDKLSNVNIPDSVTVIKAGMFNNCRNLTNVNIPNSVTSIEKNAFSYCHNLKNITIPKSVTSIGEKAFTETGLESIVVPHLINSIELGTFMGCTSLTSVTIPSSVTLIGDFAFEDCTNLSDVYYAGSKINWETIQIDASHNTPLRNATIHYNSTGPGGSGENPAPGPDIPSIPDTDMSIKKVNLPFNGHSVSANWGWSMFDQSAVKNQVWDIFDDNNLAIAGLALSRAAEDSQQQVESILGSENYLGFKAIRSQNYASTANQHPAVTFASKPILQNGKGEYVVAIVVRGTQPGNWDDYWTDISSLWGGFSTATDNLQIQLNEFLVDNCSAGIQDLRGKVKFFVTGHSLGAAVANVMAKNLSNEYGADNVFAYTFASPTTIQSAQSAGNIFNILNIEDGVTKLPGLYDHRHGWEVYFHRDLSAEDGFYNRFKELTGRDFNKDSAHDTVVYMSYLLSMSASSRNTKVTLLHVLCPVDIEIYSSQNQLVGQVRDNIASDTVAGKTYIRVVDDEKYIYLLGDDNYSINLFGTGEGTMEYTVQNIDLDNSEVLIEKTFENVTLSSGKKFISKVDVQDNTINGTDVSKVPLYVLDSAGNPEKNVLPDGKGTEVPIDTPLECEHSYTTNVTAPTCTERGYTTYTCTKCGNSYVDTYTATLGHSYGEWTVVTPATTTTNGLRERICTRCSDRQTNVIPATGGGSSHDNPGSSSSDPTYRIDAPSKITGGTIKITPTSARENQRVTITVKPNTSYILGQLIVTDNKGDVLALADKGDGKYTFTMPKGKVTVNAVFQPIKKPWSTPFQDVTADMWCYNAVRFVSENDLMNGISSNLFAPNTNLSRAQLAQILYNKEGRPEVEKATFTDVPDGEWYSNAVAWAAEKGIVSGYGNGLFGPGDNITREQLAVMLWRYAGSPAATNKELHFADANEASSYALEALCWATENSIINGYGNGELAPKGESTRAQVAQMLKNFLEK